jgi:hypothetical protein
MACGSPPGNPAARRNFRRHAHRLVPGDTCHSVASATRHHRLGPVVAYRAASRLSVSSTVYFFNQLLDAPHSEADDPVVTHGPVHIQAGRYRLRVGVVSLDERLQEVALGRVSSVRFDALVLAIVDVLVQSRCGRFFT